MLETHHWHVPLYVEGLRNSGVQVCAISGKNPRIISDLASHFKCTIYSNYVELLDKENIDFAFTYGTHKEMPGILSELIKRRIPFATEKPVTNQASKLQQLAEAASKNSVFNSVALIFRYSELFKYLKRIPPESFSYMDFHFIAGPPDRYSNIGCSWMLDPNQSLGGCTMNLPVHFIDMFTSLTGQKVVHVCSLFGNHKYRLHIEDHSFLLIEGDKGSQAMIETGYVFPSNYKLRATYYSFTTKNGYIEVYDNTLRHWKDGKKEFQVEIETDTEPYYKEFVLDTLNRFEKGKPPIASLLDLVTSVQVIEEAQCFSSKWQKTFE